TALKARWSAPPATPDLASVRAAELRTILGSDAGADPAAVETWGLALSGGGIRSATFGLGVLQALSRLGLLRCFHYQSTVSGGGYIGAFLQALIRRHGFAQAFETLAAGMRGAPSPGDEGPGARPIRHLREYSNYLAPRKSPLSGDTLGMAGTYVRNVLLVQVQLCALILALCLLPLLLYAGADTLSARNPTLPLSLAGLTGMLAVALLAWVSTFANRRPVPVDGEPPQPPRRLVLAALATILALALACMLGALGLARFERLPGLFSSALGWLPAVWTTGGSCVGEVRAAVSGLVWHAWLVLVPWCLRRAASGDARPPPLQRHPWRFVLGTVGAAAFAGVAFVLLRGWLAAWAAADGGLWHVLVVGPLLVVAAVALTAIVHLGLAGPAMSDLQREIWARVGGKTCALVALGM